MSNDKPIFEGWAILELMGHRRLGGYVSQAEMFGTAMLRIDVPGPDETCALCCGGKVEAVGADGPIVCGACEGKGQKPTIAATQFYSGGSIYCLTPTTEEVARAVAAHIISLRRYGAGNCRHCRQSPRARGGPRSRRRPGLRR